FNQDPEPSQYEGEKAKVSGFVLKDDNLPQNYFIIARFILSCCAADARPIGIPVHFDPARQTFENDQWIELQGEFFTTELDGETVPAIELNRFENIPVPENPYANL
ncbi:MAG TPA: TIGR03943 family protein, partial [Candidatus Gracilibacteria bacterium]|nr:TIGR03943 family protein [Candidatus Gracilibacteria bacterium]